MFYKKVNLQSNKECFEFLANHATYSTLNSWNGLKSIAHNVKLYNLPLKHDWRIVEQALEDDDYMSINMTLDDWAIEHDGFKITFNGRSGGYLVLYNTYNNCHCFNNQSHSPCMYDDYESWKKDVIEDYGSLKNYHDELVVQVKIVQDFDKLCDNLVALCDEITNDYLEAKAKAEREEKLAAEIDNKLVATILKVTYKGTINQEEENFIVNKYKALGYRFDFVEPILCGWSYVFVKNNG